MHKPLPKLTIIIVCDIEKGMYKAWSRVQCLSYMNRTCALYDYIYIHQIIIDTTNIHKIWFT